MKEPPDPPTGEWGKPCPSAKGHHSKIFKGKPTCIRCGRVIPIDDDPKENPRIEVEPLELGAD